MTGIYCFFRQLSGLLQLFSSMPSAFDLIAGTQEQIMAYRIGRNTIEMIAGRLQERLFFKVFFRKTIFYLVKLLIPVYNAPRPRRQCNIKRQRICFGMIEIRPGLAFFKKWSYCGYTVWDRKYCIPSACPGQQAVCRFYRDTYTDATER